MRVALVALLLLGTLLAGCGDTPAPRTPAEIVVQSKPPEEINSNDTAEDIYTPSPKTRGHLAGVVVDEAIRPIEGAVVHLPGLDLTETSDRDGSFGFVDLYPGPYFITINMTGYYAAEAVLEVKPDEFTRAKVILQAIPPPDPYHMTQQFDGFADVGADPIFGLTASCTCSFDFYLETFGLQAIVIEATMSEYSGGAGGSNGFYHNFGPNDCCATLSSGSLGNPMRVEVREGLQQDSHFDLTVEPEGFPVPEMNKKFKVFVTTFYNSVPPTGWSFVNGDL